MGPLVQNLGREDPLEKEMATHSTMLPWQIPWTEEPFGPESMASQELDTTYQLNHHQVNIVPDRVNTICFSYYGVIIIVAVTVKY